MRPDASAAARPLRAIGVGLLDLLLPRHCAACDRPMDLLERGVVCGRCWSRLALLPHPQCARCGHPVAGLGALVTLRSTPDCRGCALLPPYVRAARSVCWVGEGGSGAAVVHALKYGGWRDAAAAMGERMARLAWPADVFAERSLLAPVPLARARLRERGYNPSAHLARALAARWGTPVAPVLERQRATATQTRLTPGERLANVRGAFRATDAAAASLRGAHVVLVDDVVTTCATLNACAAALFAAGARIVSYVTFGRARTAGDPS